MSSEIERLKKIKSEMEKRKVDTFPMTLEHLNKLLEEIEAIKAEVQASNDQSLIVNDDGSIITGGNF